jgi:hypothetical protein
MPTGMYAGSTVSALLLSKITVIQSDKINYSSFPIKVTSFNKKGIRINLSRPISYRLSIVSVNGKQVFSINESGKTGAQYKSFRNKPISSGLYYIYLQTKNAENVGKMFIVE